MITHQLWNSRGNYNYNAFFYTGISYASHFHSNYELMYVEYGTAQMAVNGEAVELVSHEFLLIPPYTVHSFDVDRSSRVWVGVFSADFITVFAKKNTGVGHSKFRCGKPSEKFLIEHLLIKDQPDLYMTKACLYLVCSECQKNAVPYDMRSEDDFKSRVVGYISDNLSGDITLADVAASLNYEYHYFSSLFHRCFEVNFKEFINLFRFEQACRLLAENTADIAFVSMECGFKSIRNFNRVFKKLSGITPSDYRNSLK